MQSYTFKSQFTTNFEYIKPISAETNKFTVIYLHGLFSTPWGRKGEEVKAFCQKNGLGCLRYEMIGHCTDQDNYEQADLNIWKAQALEVIDNIAQGPVLLLGHSIGGWLSLLCAEARPQRVLGVIGTAAAPDFIKGLKELFSSQQKADLEKYGKVEFPTKEYTYVFTKKFIESADPYYLLDRCINIKCPVQLIQGMEDHNYPWKYTLKIAEQIGHDQVVVKLLKNSGHRLQQDQDIKEILLSLQSFLKL